MKLTLLSLPLLGALLGTAACGYRGQPADDEVSYTRHVNRSTIVTVHRPPERHRDRPVPVGTTSLTSAEYVSEKNAPVELSNDPADRRLNDQIRRALTSDKNMRDVSLERVQVSAVNHRVALRGSVSTLADKVAVEQRVREVKGVEAVDNDIDVLR